MILATLFLALFPQQPRNALVILFDDVGPADVAAVAENVQGLAAQGMNYTRAYSWPVCTPSRLAALLGVYPRRAVVHRVGSPNPVGIGDLSMNAHTPRQDELLVEDLSLAEVLQLTHRTGLFGKWHLGRADLAGQMNQLVSGPFVQGFQVVRAVNPTVPDAGVNATGYYGWYRIDDGVVAISHQYATNAQRDDFIAWWTGTSGPKLGVLAWSAAHSPFDTPPGYSTKPTTREKFLDVLDYADTQLGAVLGAIDLEDTFVILTSDNGTPDDARLAGAPSGVWKGSTFEGGVKVPFVIAGPGIMPGVSLQLVSLVDIPATVCDLLGVCLPPGVFSDSVSIVGPTPRSFVFTERYEAVGGGAMPQPVGYDDVAVIRATWKLRVVDADGDGPGGTAELLYNLVTDPFELFPKTPSQAALPYATLSADLATIPARA